MGVKPSGDTSRVARFLRALTLVLAGGQAVYWLYTFRLIAVNSNPQGDGMEFAAVFPFGLIFIALVVPALLLGWRGRMFPLTAVLAIIALILNVLLFLEIASELTHDGARPLNL